ncbi:MAG: hypothetical protein AAGD01_18810 [Acidobacteriota bacterium]
MSRQQPPRRRSQRLWIANLDVEESWAAASPDGRPPEPDATLPQRRPSTPALALRRRMSLFGAALRVAAAEGDWLWTPEPLLAEDLPARGLPASEKERLWPSLRLLHGPLPSAIPPEILRQVDEVRCWGESPQVEVLRRRWRKLEKSPGETVSEASRRTATAAARVNHRSWALDLSQSLGMALPRVARVHKPGDLAEALRGSSLASPSGRWVIKAPWSAAGRHRLLGGEAENGKSEAEHEDSARSLLRRWGELIVEPWMERSDDFGALAEVGPSGGLQSLSFHRQSIGPKGAFHGLEIVAGEREGEAVGLRPGEEQDLRRAMEATAEALAAEGYAGPFGIDAWRYRGATADSGNKHQGECFHPLGEINARWSFGRVLRAAEERLLAAGTLRCGERLALRLGQGRADPQPASPPRRVLPVVLGRRAETRVPQTAEPAPWVELEID